MSATAVRPDSTLGMAPARLTNVGRAVVPALIVVLCAALAGWAPIGVSIVAVFLFAGPHNWFEARYFLTRMPARWGALTPYFSLGLGGSLLLGGLFASLPWLAAEQPGIGLQLVAGWNTLLTLWIVSLALIRSRQNPRRNWGFLVPLGLVLIAVNWLWPLAWSLGLVFLHPLIALWFLDRELKRLRSVWLMPYRMGLLMVPVCLGGLFIQLAAGADLPNQDVVSWQITQHAGAGVVSHVSTHLLVAAHVFLELLHYLVWIVVIPSLSVRGPIWRIDTVPLARRSTAWRRVVAAIVLAGIGIAVMLWGSFLADYSWTRNVYFTVAILHVLGEVPFLLRLL